MTPTDQPQTEAPSPVSPTGPISAPAAVPAGIHGPRWQWVVLGVLPFVLFLVVWVAPAAYMLRAKAEPAPADTPQPPNGIALYARHCVQCHGDKGDGTGVSAANLWPLPRNFGEGRFRLVTTQNGIPTDDDLLAVLRNGIPGSSMPAFGHLGEPELRALIERVRALTYAGVFERFQQQVDDGDIDLAEAYRIAAKRCAPGPVLAIPKQFPPPTAASLARGKEVYAKNCASCHGPGGRGDGPQVQQLVNTDGSRARPRDLTLGRFKGGADPAHVYARIMLGLPGSPMPASNLLPQAEILDLGNYVLSLSRPGAAAATGPAGDRPSLAP